MAEWSKAADCKSVRLISRWFESNPSQLKRISKNRYDLVKFKSIDSLKIVETNEVKNTQRFLKKKTRAAVLRALHISSKGNRISMSMLYVYKRLH